MSLQDLIIQNARHTPDAIAIESPSMSLSYGKLDKLADWFAHRFAALGVQRGDRVGIWLSKSAYAVAAMQGALRLRAIYVPLDPLSPSARISTILQDCDMRVLVTTRQRVQTIASDDLHHTHCFCIDDEESRMDDDDLTVLSEASIPEPESSHDDIAYILYTSGSTGKPKGVCISNRNALAFIEWAASTLEATCLDRFANHAPLHFDLSVLDLYVAFLVGATTYLIADEISYMSQRLVNLLVEESISVWYSVPSVLILMMEQGGLLDTHASHLRALLFAGEPFPIKHLRRLYQRYRSTARFFNLYGPTETNVCAYYEVTHIPENWDKPVPIGKSCSGDHIWALQEDGTTVQPGQKGQLMVTGPTVMSGYWGQPAHGDKPYATGDIVQMLDDGNYVYVGRQDQMEKVRGHRIELGDIEAALEQHPAIQDAAVIVAGAGLEARLVAFVTYAASTMPPTFLEIKRHCAENLPRYMIVDEVCAVPVLPRTRNGKIDRLALRQQERGVHYAAHSSD
jgi:amino acid adenylation domain-containing protein